MNRLSTRVAYLATLFLSISSAAWAQDATGKIAGNITDPSGAAIAGAHIVVTSKATKAAREAVSDRQGYYQVINLPIGAYEVAADATGFGRAVAKPANELEINQTLRVDLKLEIGATSTVVEVESQGSIVETENATVGGTVTGQAIFELPLNGRNTLDLLATQPGVTPTNPDSGATGSYSIAGGRTDSVTYLLDGGNNNNLLSNAVVVSPNPDAVAEFRVLENDYGAEYGRNAGGVVSIVTRSGTNSIHGTAYDYLRNDALNANKFFNNEQGIARDVLKRNQFGLTVGGPILIPKLFDGRNKLFFFFSYQGQRQTALTQDGKTTTFTPLEAQGNFSQAVSGGPDPSVVKFLQNNPFYQADPALAAQGIIDPAKIDPVAKAYFAKGLIPTSASGFLFPSGSAIDNIDEFLGKFDYNISGKDVLSGTFTSRDYPHTVPFNQSNVSGYPISRETVGYFGTVTETHTFSPSIVNELRVTAQRNNNHNATPLGSFASVTPAALGIGITPDTATGPTLLGFGGSNLNIGYSPNGPTNLIDNTYAFYDNLSWVKGKHSMKYGFYFSPYQNNTVYDYYINGEFFYYGPSTSVGSGTDFADFLLGLPDEYLQFPKAPSNIRSYQYAFYGQDSWKVSKKLTLTYGLRFEYSQPKYDTQGRSFSLSPGATSTRFPNAPTSLLFPGDAGAPKGSNYPDKNDFAPRFGFAWDVFGNAKTSLRGGVGVFYDILKGEDNLQFNGQAPFFGFADIFFSPPDPNLGPAVGNMTNPFPAAGAVNPFPSKPPTANINFNDAGFLPFGGGGVYFVDPHLRTPYVFQYNLSIQQELAPNLVWESGYLGSSSHKLTSLVDANPFVLGTNTRLLNNIPGASFSYLDQFQNVSNAGYNAWENTLTKRFGGGENSMFGGSFFTFAHTWSHQIDNASGFRERNAVVPYYNHNAFRASGDTDLRQFLSFSGGWDVPFHRWFGGPKLLTSGWSVYPIVSWRTGFPLDVFAGLSTSRRDPGPAGDGQAGGVRADLVGSSVGTYNPQVYQTITNNIAGQSSSGNYWFNPNSFSVVNINNLDQAARNGTLNGQYSYGTFPRNAFRGPGRFNVDLTISKHFQIGERLNAELRADFFNLSNSAQFDNPDLSVNDPTFGQISTTYDPRIVQLALHLRF